MENQEVNRGRLMQAGGADAKCTGFTVGGPTDESTVLADATCPMRRRQPTGNKQKEVEGREQQKNSTSKKKNHEA